MTVKHERIIDWDLATKLAAGDKDFARHLMNMLIEALPAHQAEISSAIKANDFEALAIAAHKLAGATCYTGTPTLKVTSKALEDAAKEKDATGVEEHHQKLNDIIKKIHDLLD
jgi:two-component system, NarL family, sensor histidine kinase BarA